LETFALMLSRFSGIEVFVSKGSPERSLAAEANYLRLSAFVE